MRTNAVMKYIQQIITKVEEIEKNECKPDERFHKMDYLYIRNDFCSVCENTPLENVLINAKEVRLSNEAYIYIYQLTLLYQSVLSFINF